MTREEEIYGAEFASNPYFMSTDGPQVVGAHQLGFKHGVEYADAHPSDETIMRILNCIGYEEKSWIEFVRERLDVGSETCRTCKHRQRWRNEFSPKVTQVCELKKGRTQMGFKKIKVTDKACRLYEKEKGI